jgi:adenosylcobinamide kinase/adenosylcobinamide-phosphate guanylyltransferase
VITLVLGGARSGKSAWAERRATEHPAPFTYVATIKVSDDPDLAARVAAHRARRPSHWRTVEVGHGLPALIAETPGTIFIDSLGPWVAGFEGRTIDSAALCHALSHHDGDVVIVSDEVGLGVHPSSESGRLFRDELGRLNQAIAEVADQVFLVVAGRALRLDDAS